MPPLDQRAFKRGDMVSKKASSTEEGLVMGPGPRRGTVIVLWEIGPFAGRELPYYEEELHLLKMGPTVKETLDWFSDALQGLRKRNIQRLEPFTQDELDLAELAMFRGETPNEFLNSLTKETK